MINKQMIQAKIKLIQADLSQLKRFEKLSFGQIAGDYDTHKVVERIIELVVNEAIDINQHLIGESKLGEASFDFKESFLLLVKFGVYRKKFAEEISKSVGLRNVLVHQYRKLDEKIFYNSIKDCLKQYTQYCRYILDYLKKN